MTELFIPPLLFFCSLSLFLSHLLFLFLPFLLTVYSSPSTLNFVFSTSLPAVTPRFQPLACKRVQTLKLPTAAHFSVGLCDDCSRTFLSGRQITGRIPKYVCSCNRVAHFCSELCKLECDQPYLQSICCPVCNNWVKTLPESYPLFSSSELFFLQHLTVIFNKFI